MKKLKKVTVTSAWLNEVFDGNESEVFNYLRHVKSLQMSALDSESLKMYKNAHSKGYNDYDREKLRDDIKSNFPDIGLSIKIEVAHEQESETRFF